MEQAAIERKNCRDNVIRRGEIAGYLDKERDFIDDERIERILSENRDPDASRVRDIIQKALSIQTLLPEETASLLNVRDRDLWDEIFSAAVLIKRKVYDNRVVTFAPLYCSNMCVNNCEYCGFRKANKIIKRRKLELGEVKRETEVLAGEIGHKRLIVVYGEHPATDIRYILDTIRTIYNVKVKVRNGYGQIRRVNVNAAPMSIEDLVALKEGGVGTYQVFQETYHHDTYRKVHPPATIKGDYQWRLYALHRAMEAGVDDVAIGVLFGLYDWRFEVMGMLYHARDLEARFGIGPHTISFPRLEPAANTPFIHQTAYKVADEDFKRIIAVLRLSIPYAGMIVTAREKAGFIREVIPMCTQRDASTRIGIGSYSDRYDEQEEKRQQFMLGDTRGLDEVIRELADMGHITSFCTAGYRCGRTGKCIMDLLRTGKEGKFCKLNAVLTFKEWLEDFACDETKKIGEKIIQDELKQIKESIHSFPQDILNKVSEYYTRIERGERDLYF